MAPLLASSFSSSSIVSTLGTDDSTKTVRFSENTSIHEVSRLAEESSEKAELWYSKVDFDTFKESNRQIVQLMELKLYIQSEEHCTRGLESKLREAAARRRSIRKAARNAVLGEQHYQRQGNEGGVVDADFISRIYIGVSKDAVLNAKKLGAKDERFVRSEEKFTLPPRSKSTSRLSSMFSLRRVAGAAA